MKGAFLASLYREMTNPKPMPEALRGLLILVGFSFIGIGIICIIVALLLDHLYEPEFDRVAKPATWGFCILLLGAGLAWFGMAPEAPF